MERTQTVADRYTLGPLIERGGMAEVFKARDEVLARTVAIKMLLGPLTQDDEVVARFRQEALAAARLTHPNIVSIYDTGSDTEGDLERHFIVMEYCSGGSLRTALEERGSFPAEEAASVGATVCSALGYAHAEGVIHRDIKPGNVLLVEHGTLKVTDFGIAKAGFGSGDITTTGSILGTVAYISPEQARGDEPDPRSDLYSLGIMLYELVTGRPPFKADTDVATALCHVREAPPPPRALRAGIPKSLEATILKALEKDPDDRFASAEEMRDELEAIGAGSSTRPIRVPAMTQANRKETSAGDEAETGPMPFIKTEGRRNAPVIFLVIGAILAAAVIAALVGSQDDDGEADKGSAGGRGGSQQVKVVDATDFDPHGGDGEHPELVKNAFDGDPGTSWRTSNYSATLEAIGKAGVGLLFDLGEETEVGRVTILLDRAGYNLELRAGNSTGDDENAFEVIERFGSSDARTEIEPEGSYRYWLVWLKAFPGGGGRGVVQEVTFDGS